MTSMSAASDLFCAVTPSSPHVFPSSRDPILHWERDMNIPFEGIAMADDEGEDELKGLLLLWSTLLVKPSALLILFLASRD